MNRRTSYLLCAAILVAFPLACGDDDGSGGAGNTPAGGSAPGGGETGGAPSGGGGGVSTGGGGAATGGMNQGGMPPLQIAHCGNVPQPYECGDLLDNDMDGLVDSYDPDCLGACDNTENSYFGGIPGQQNAPCKQDCYWDTNTGSGNDDCYWDHKCDPNSVDPNYYPEPDVGDQCAYEGDAYEYENGLTCAEGNAAQSDTCAEICGPLTPNGCDCFGCCELPAGTGKFVWLGSIGADGDTVCTADQIENPAVCHPCVQVAACANDCKPCEICIGKPEPEPGCNEGGGGGGGGPSGQCEEGVQPCGLPGQDPCPFGQYCVTGCCIPEPAG